jgi:homoserine kinase type II
LRINEGKRDDDVAAEANLVERLREGGLPTPPVVKTTDGRWFTRISGKPITLFPWLDGYEADPRPLDPSSVRVAGHALGILHRSGNRLGVAALPRNHYTIAELERRLATFAADDRFREVVPLLSDELARAQRRAAPASGLIHQDLFPDNLLVDANGALVAVLDLEQATFGAFVYDLAVCANAWCWTGQEIWKPSVDAMLDSYECERPLASAERSAFVAEARLAAARFTITRITDVFMPSNVDEDLRRRKDWRDYARRLAFWRAA